VRTSLRQRWCSSIFILFEPALRRAQCGDFRLGCRAGALIDKDFYVRVQQQESSRQARLYLTLEKLRNDALPCLSRYQQDYFPGIENVLHPKRQSVFGLRPSGFDHWVPQRFLRQFCDVAQWMQ
jgi:hypothetical protein